MDKQTTRQDQALMRIGQFGEDHEALFPTGSLGAESLADVAAIVAEITGQEVERRGATGEASYTRAQGRRSLGRALRKVRLTAQLLAGDEPAIGDAFPRWDGKRSDRTLLQTARSYAADAAPLADRFVRHGMPATFMGDFQAAIDGFAEALDRHQKGRSTTTEANSRIRSAIARGMRAARRLDAFLVNTLEHDDPLLAAWKGIRRIGPGGRRRRKADAGQADAAPASTNIAAAATSSPVTCQETHAA